MLGPAMSSTESGQFINQLEKGAALFIMHQNLINMHIAAVHHSPPDNGENQALMSNGCYVEPCPNQ
tara:strand:+ start:421 stop:618 length:198 start_codon:yes stop_codon:yes gene_type:complete